jgi:hypothetical protein
MIKHHSNEEEKGRGGKFYSVIYSFGVVVSIRSISRLVFHNKAKLGDGQGTENAEQDDKYTTLRKGVARPCEQHDSSTTNRHARMLTCTLHIVSLATPDLAQAKQCLSTSRRLVRPKGQPVPAAAAAVDRILVEAVSAAVDVHSLAALDDTVDGAEVQVVEAAAHNPAATYSVDPSDHGFVGSGSEVGKSIAHDLCYYCWRQVESWACRTRWDCSCTLEVVVAVVRGAAAAVVDVGNSAVVGVETVASSFVEAYCKVMVRVRVACHSLVLQVRLLDCNYCMHADAVAVAQVWEGLVAVVDVEKGRKGSWTCGPSSP